MGVGSISRSGDADEQPPPPPPQPRPSGRAAPTPDPPYARLMAIAKCCAFFLLREEIFTMLSDRKHKALQGPLPPTGAHKLQGLQQKGCERTDDRQAAVRGRGGNQTWPAASAVVGHIKKAPRGCPTPKGGAGGSMQRRPLCKSQPLRYQATRRARPPSRPPLRAPRPGPGPPSSCPRKRRRRCCPRTRRPTRPAAGGVGGVGRGEGWSLAGWRTNRDASA